MTEKRRVHREIDSATLYELALMMHVREPEEVYEWGWSSARTATQLLLFTTRTAISAGPGPAGEAGHAYGHLCDGLRRQNRFMPLAKPSNRARAAASSSMKAWLRRREHLEKVSLTVESYLHDERNFLPWIDLVIRTAWIEHGTRLGGLFEYDYSAQIAKILSVRREHVERLHMVSAKSADLERLVRRYRRRPTLDASMQELVAAYLAGALLRGVFHHYLASQAKQRPVQVRHHPMPYCLLCQP